MNYPFPKEEEEVSPQQMPAIAPTIAPVAPKVAQAPITPQAPVKLPGMPEGVSIPDIEGYLGKQRGNLDKYGPEAQMDLQQQTLDDRNSLGSRATSGLKGFADAVMMGVAGAGNPGWQQQYDTRQDSMAKEKMGTLQNANAANLKRTEASMTLDAMDPKSELSKIKQQSYAPLWKQLGFPEKALENVSASNMENTLQLMTNYGSDAQKAAIAKYQADMTLEESRRNHMEMEGIARGNQAQGQQKIDLDTTKAKADAASEILKRAKNDRIWGIPVPFTSDVSGKEEKAAQQTLMDTMNGTPRTTFSDEYYQSLQSGDQYVGPDGKTRIKQ